MNLPAAGWIAGRSQRAMPLWLRSRRRLSVAVEELLARPAATVLVLGSLAVVTTAVLEAINFRNGWLAFEDLSATVAPATATLAVGLSVHRGDPASRRFRVALTVSLGLVTSGQTLACVPDVTGSPSAALSGISNASYAVGAILAVAAVLVALYGRLHDEERWTAVLNGSVLIAAAMTFVLANWLRHSTFAGQFDGSLQAPLTDLALQVVSALFLASAAAIIVAALTLRVEPARGSVWFLALGIMLLSIAWEGWINRSISGGRDTIEPMDFIFPTGALAAGWAGVSWNLRAGGRERYQNLARVISDWVPVAAIAACALLDVMPRARPFLVDPVAIGTCSVVFLAVGRQALLQRREREARDRLGIEMSERAAVTVSLASLEPGHTVEESAGRICREALKIDGIDTVMVFGITPSGVVPLAQGGPPTRPVKVGQPLPDDAALAIEEHAALGLWLENWSTKAATTSFDRATVEAGLLAEAMAPLLWNDEMVGVLALGATSPEHAKRLTDRVATLTEFSVMSAALLGPALADRCQFEITVAEVHTVIATRSFTPVFQPIVDLATREFVGYEALVRFSDGTRPDVRFLAADKVGMMVELERACLREQLAQAHLLPEGTFLDLNVSPALALEPNALTELLSTADRQCVLEVTEHAEIDDYPKLMEALGRVRHVAQLAVDDAGAGYAGLRHMLELRPQYVKLDISLVRNVDSDPARQAMVRGMAYFADSVGCKLIAEGIETANELTALRLLEIPYGQGYYLARPAPISRS